MPARPHLFDDISKGLCNLTLHPQRVGEVQLLQVRVLLEVLSEGRSVAQTLQTHIHTDMSHNRFKLGMSDNIG